MTTLETRLMDAREREIQMDFNMREAKDKFKAALRARNEARDERWKLESELRVQKNVDSVLRDPADFRAELEADGTRFEAAVDTLLEEL
mgnify:CR=1 FL=1|jgi:hypothetical protein